MTSPMFSEEAVARSKYALNSVLHSTNEYNLEVLGGGYNGYTPSTPQLMGSGVSLNKSAPPHHQHGTSNGNTNNNHLNVMSLHSISHSHSGSNTQNISSSLNNSGVGSSYNGNNGSNNSNGNGNGGVNPLSTSTQQLQKSSGLAELAYSVVNRAGRSDSVQTKLKPNENVTNIDSWAKIGKFSRIFDSNSCKKENIFEKYTLRLQSSFEKGYLNQHYSSQILLLRITNLIGIVAVSYGFTKKAIFMLIAIRILCFNLFAFSIFLSFLKNRDLYKKLFHPLFLFSFTTFFITILLEYKTTTTTLILFLYVVIFCCLYALGCLLFIWMVMCNLMNAICFIIFIFLESTLDRNNLISFVIYILTMFLVGASHLYVLEKFRKESFIAEKKLIEESNVLKIEKEKSSKLLNNILPDFIIENIGFNFDKGEIYIPEPEEFETCSILCFDIVQFTNMSAQLESPSKLVSLLTEIFREFDKVVLRNGCQKIKTDGDAYICASGLKSKKKKDDGKTKNNNNNNAAKLNESDPDSFEHFEALIDVAIEIMGLSVLHQNKENLNVRFRCGVAAGSVYGGVIGSQKYQFDIWGDTIARSHTLEQLGSPGKVHVGDTIKKHKNAGKWMDKYDILANTECAEQEHSDEFHKVHGECMTSYFVDWNKITRAQKNIELSLSNGVNQISNAQVFESSANFKKVATDGGGNINKGFAMQISNEDVSSSPYSNSIIQESVIHDEVLVQPHHHQLEQKKSQTILTNERDLTNTNNHSPSSNSPIIQNEIFNGNNYSYSVSYSASNSNSTGSNGSNGSSGSGGNSNGSGSHISNDNELSTSISIKEPKEMKKITFKGKLMKFLNHIKFNNEKIEKEIIEIEEEFVKITKLRKYFLFFENLKIEKYFHRYVIVNNVTETKFFLIIGLILHLMFYLDDYIMQSTPYFNSNIIYLVMGITFLVYIGLSFTRVLRTPIVYQVSFFILLCAFGVCTVLELIRFENPLARSSLTRVCATLFYLNVFHSLNFLSVLFLNLFIFTFFIISSSLISPSLTDHLYQTDYIGFVIVLLIQICSSYGMKLAMRKAWIVNCKVNYKTINVNRERDKFNFLLMSIFPESVLGNLREMIDTPNIESKGIEYVKSYENLSIMFIQIAGFSEFDEPKELIKNMNEIFSFFDNIIRRKYGGTVEKIKTIGNTYMAVSGLDGDPHFLEKMADFALDVKSCINHVHKVVRIGISVGPLVAGCIGISRAKFDVWGDTANTASRMQSNANDNEVMVTDQVFTLLHKSFYFDDRKEIQIKGKGLMVTHLLKGKVASTDSGTKNWFSGGPQVWEQKQSYQGGNTLLTTNQFLF